MIKLTKGWKPSAADRTSYYNQTFPDRVPLSEKNGMVGGCFMIGSCYKNPNKLYGAYPHGYLERVHSMFPDASDILHVFSGGLTRDAAMRAAYPNIMQAKDEGLELGLDADVVGMELVDSKGPEDGRYPTWQGDVTAMPEDWAERFDLVLADPPYSAEDCEVYGVKPTPVKKVLAELHRVTKVGGNLVWLDQKWPMHNKNCWKTWGTVGLVRSTNHRMRLVSFFQRQP